MKSLIIVFTTIAGCLHPLLVAGQDSTHFPTLGQIIRLDPKLDELLDSDAKLEVLSSGFDWTEGPVWHKEGEFLLFSDIPPNRVFKWEEGKGASIYLEPSGYTGVADYGAEPGSNGLLLNAEGLLVSCEHGDRRLSVMTKDGGKRTLVDNYEGKRLNSPNDVVQKSNDDFYFTDPPYGLPKRWEDPLRELDFCGVYRLSTDGTLTLLTKDLARPNGIAFSPDEKTLYVAQSDPEAATWTAFPVNDDGILGEGTTIYDATSMVGEEHPGLPDGMKVDEKGNLWATGPGGVHIMTPDGTPIGRIATGERTSNCAWGNDGTTLYITADTYLCRIQTKVKGNGF